MVRGGFSGVPVPLAVPAGRREGAGAVRLFFPAWYARSGGEKWKGSIYLAPCMKSWWSERTAPGRAEAASRTMALKAARGFSFSSFSVPSGPSMMDVLVARMRKRQRLLKLGDECHVIFAEVVHGNGGDFIGDVGTEGKDDGLVPGGGKISCKSGEVVRITGNQRGGEQVNVFLKVLRQGAATNAA